MFLNKTGLTTVYRLDSKTHKVELNRGCLRPISDIDFQFLAIWAAQGDKGNKSNCEF